MPAPIDVVEFRSSNFGCFLKSSGDKKEFCSAYILQIADVRRVVLFLFLLCF